MLKINTVLTILVVLLIGSTLYGQEIPDEMRPFVMLKRKVNVVIYKDPVFNSQRSKVLQTGQLVNQKFTEVSVGSGTIINANGLILTNYHVCQMEKKLRYDQASNRLQVVEPANPSLIVYGLDDNDPLKPPVAQYIADPIGLDEKHDTALLKIVSDDTGKELQENRFPAVTLGDPFTLSLNAKLLILGYPAKGGRTITVTDGNFLGYYQNDQYWGLDGFIKTNAAMSPGNSGGAALHQSKLIGVPTAVTLPSLAGSDMGYIHPVTWAVKVLTIAKQKYGLAVPEIPLEWLKQDYNSDETARNIYISGETVSANSKQPLSAAIMITRPDRSFTQIRQLHLELQGVMVMFMFRQMYSAGARVEDIADYFDLPAAAVRKILAQELSKQSLSDDARQVLSGEFFYQVAESDEDGFFILSVPREKRLKFYGFKQGYHVVNRTIKSGAGSRQALQNVYLYQQ